MRLVTILFAMAILSGLAAPAADFFSCGFAEMTARNGSRSVTPYCYGAPASHAAATGGRGALFAMEKLEDFRKITGKSPDAPLPAVVYRNLKDFPETGFCELEVTPFFNQTCAYRKPKKGNEKFIHYGIFSLNGPEKSSLALYIANGKLSARFIFSGGGRAVLNYPVRFWKKGRSKKITVVWGKNEQKLYVDGKLAQAAAAPGELGRFTSLELGGHGPDLSLQGVIRSIRIASGLPAVTDARSADPEIALDAKLLRDWTVKEGPLEAAPRDKGIVFTYGGGRERPVTAVLAKPAAVEPGTFVRLDLKLFKHRWSFGSKMQIFVEFTDKSGRTCERLVIDRSNVDDAYRPMDFEELASPIGIGLDLDYFNYFRVPAGCTGLRLAAEFSGNPCEAEIKSLRLFETDPAFEPWFSQPEKGEQLAFDRSPAVSDARAREILKARKKAVSSLVRNKDRVEWCIDGKKVPPAIFHNTTSDTHLLASEFYPAGYRLFTSAVILGRSVYRRPYTQTWREDGSFDLKAMEEAVLRVIREAPDAHVVLNLLVIPNALWLKENRSELRTLPDGTPGLIRGWHYLAAGSREFPTAVGESWSPSFHSRKYRKDIAEVLEKLMREFEKTPAANAVVGVYITGGDDIQFRAPREPDFSPAARPAFRAFLLEKYGSSAAIAKAWRKEKFSWDDVVIPSKERLTAPGKACFSGVGPCLESDYLEFVSSECAELKTAIRAGVKRGAPRLLTGGYDNAMSLAGSTLFGGGRMAMEKIISDPACDFLISLPPYGRQRDECTIPMGLKAYTGSMRLHKKLIVSEMDIRNPAQPPLVWWNRSRNWQAVHNSWTFRQFLNLNAGYAAAWGGMFHVYPLGGKVWYSTPEAVDAWRKALAVAAAAPGETPGSDSIAWVNDDRYCDFFPISPEGHYLAGGWNRNICAALWSSQVRFDAYLPKDLFHPDFKAPRILLLGNAMTLPPETISRIRKRFLREGRTLIWSGMPGSLSGAPLADISRAVGFDLSRPPEIADKSVFVSPEGKNPLLAGVSGFLFAPPLHGEVLPFANAAAAAGPGVEVLGYFQGTRHPGMVMRKTKAGTEIFIGQQGAVTSRLLRNIAKAAGIHPVTEGEDLMIRGGGLIVLGASAGNGVRRVFFPAGVENLTCLTGQKILKRGSGFVDVDLKYGECAVFRYGKGK
ncbi:MAG: beta-galactosidase [Lentisphaeria bacterium]|nr:beta-galactosidase [Lentisphaeria bacterium]